MRLHHHHRAVDQQAEVDRAQAHQVAGDAEAATMAAVAPSIESGMTLATSRPARQAAEQSEQHQHHQQAALDQVLADRPEGAAHQHAPVVDHVHAHVLRQRLRAPASHARVEAAASPRGRWRRGASAPSGRRSRRGRWRWRRRCAAGLPSPTSATSARRIGGPDWPWRTTERCPELAGRRAAAPPRAPAPGPSPAGRLRAGARVPVACSSACLELGQREAALRQRTGSARDLEGALLAAPGVHLHHAGHAAQQRRDAAAWRARAARRRCACEELA